MKLTKRIRSYMSPGPLLFFAATILANSAVYAQIISGDGTELVKAAPFSSSNNVYGPATIITAAPDWQAPLSDGAHWISFADTGYGGAVSVPTPTTGSYSTVMQVRDSFSATAGDTLQVSVWSAGTFDLQVRVPTGSPATNWTGTVTSSVPYVSYPDTSNKSCYEATSGCVTPTIATMTFGSGGDFMLFFSVFQPPAANNAPFGLMYSADWIDLPSPVPEPETYAMMLAGLGLLGLMKRREKPA